MNKSKGVTFLELVIVMVVLFMFASVIVPQLGKAATEAKMNHLCEILQEVRSYITIYKAQHRQKLPGGGDDGEEWAQAMCCATDEDGKLIAERSLDVMAYGPYMEQVPANPYNGLNSIDIDGVAGDDSDGWHFDSETGLFTADDSVEHSQL